MITALSLVLLLGAASVSTAQLKLAYVNSNEIMAKYKEAQDVQASLQELFKYAY